MYERVYWILKGSNGKGNSKLDTVQRTSLFKMMGVKFDKGHKEGEGSTSTFSEHLFIPMSLRPKYVAVDMDVSQACRAGVALGVANIDCWGNT